MPIYTTWESHPPLICFIHPRFLTYNCQGTSLNLEMDYPSVTSNGVSFSPILSGASKPEQTSKLDLWEWRQGQQKILDWKSEIL